MGAAQAASAENLRGEANGWTELWKRRIIAAAISDRRRRQSLRAGLFLNRVFCKRCVSFRYALCHARLAFGRV
jgi:hypothetical protein